MKDLAASKRFYDLLLALVATVGGKNMKTKVVILALLLAGSLLAAVHVPIGAAATEAATAINSTADELTAGDGQCSLRKAVTNAGANTTGRRCAAEIVDAMELPAGPVTDPAAPLSWTIQTVDSEGNVGRDTSLALDAAGAPHISYSYVEGVWQHDLRYARWTGDNWEIETVDNEALSDNSSLALDAAGHPHIGYRRIHAQWYGLLRYAHWTGDDWEIQTVDLEGGKGWSLGLGSLALDAAGHPHISYFRAGDCCPVVVYARWTGDDWEYQGVDGGYANSLALDAAGHPHISYYAHYPDSGLKYARWMGDDWAIETVDSEPIMGFGLTSLALDAVGGPHISYHGSGLRYARWMGDDWAIENVDSIGQYTSLALDAAGNPHISYYDQTNGDLKFARWTGDEWAIETVESEGDVGKYTSLALDAAGRPHISYYDATNGDLKLAVGAPWPPATIVVNSTADGLVAGNGECTLREAIMNANANADTTEGDCAPGFGADTISLPAGTYTLTIPGIDEDDNATGDLDILDDLTIEGAGAEATIIDANALDRVLHIPVGFLTIELSDLTVANGYAVSPAAGGGILNVGSDLTLNASIVRNNTVEGVTFGTGAGIYHIDGALTLNDSVVQENVSLPAGNSCCAGIATAAYSQPNVVVVNNSQVISNTAHNGAGLLNTAYSNLTSTMILNDSLVSGNTSTGCCGGIWATYTNGEVNAVTVLVLNRTTVSGNVAATTGGGLWARGNLAENNGAIVFVDQSTVAYNQAASGAGIYAASALEFSISNSTVSGNSAGGVGGGIYGNSDVTLINSTLNGNSAGGAGGGIYNSPPGRVTVSNSLVANSAGGDCAGSGTWSTGDFPNLDSDGTCPGFTITADPLLGPLQNNGGPSWTHALLEGSPAIDAADDTVCAAPPVNGVDQRGVFRPQGAACDIGAFELEVETEPIKGLLATNDGPTVLGGTTTLSATVKSGTFVSYAWEFGDGATGAGAVVTHTYAAAGTYTATVTATNSVSAMTATTTVIIVEPTTGWRLYLPVAMKP